MPHDLAALSRRILAEHAEMDALFLQHQEALIEQDLPRAQARYAAFHTLLKNHIALEDSQLAPLHQQLPSPQWRTLVYTAEHEKILQVAQLMVERMAAPLPAEKSARLRHIIQLIDDQRSLKNLLEHHNEREEKGMLPELAGH
jgi:hemerythrin-like domain-containing protein